MAILCLFLSGTAGLIYQVVWTRYLALFTGHTSYAVVATLMAFMGGLALGNELLGKVADRLKNPLAFYGWLEIGIGLYALFFSQIFEFSYGFYLTMAEGSSGGMLLFWKFVIAVGSLFVPTFLMGGTLPVLTKMVTHSLGELQQRLSGLYFTNSAGAVLGVGLAEFALIPWIGLYQTVQVAAILNLGVGIAALLLNRFFTGAEEAAIAPETKEESTEDPEDIGISVLDTQLVVLAIGVSGFVAMLYEVAWTRLLALAIGSSSNAFAIMLITFITGITIGAWLIGRISIRRHHLAWFAWLEIGLGLSVAATMFFYERISYWFPLMADWLNRSETTFPIYQMLQGITCFLIMIIPTIILGTTLPLASRIATAELARTGRSVGRVFSVNTIGTVLGAGVTGLFLMPMLGLARTFGLGTGLNIALGLLLLGRRSSGRLLVRSMQLMVGVALWVFMVGLLLHQDWVHHLNMGFWRSRHLPVSFEHFQGIGERSPVIFHRDGAGATVVVQYGGAEKSLTLRINGKPDASTGGDMATQLLLGHLPVLLHPNPSQALVIGCGSGVTAGAVLQHENIKHLDLVELQRDVVESAHLFAHANNRVMDNPRLTVHIDDAKSFLLSQNNYYDIIISEPSNPWIAGVAGLFSHEYYQTCASRLTDPGMMVQWIQVYNSSDEIFETILASFSSAFPHIQIWWGSPGDLILIGTRQPINPDPDELILRMQRPGVLNDLSKIQIEGPLALLSRQIRGAGSTRYIAPRTTQLHSDFFPILEHMAQSAFFARTASGLWRVYDERNLSASNLLLARYLTRHPLEVSDLRALIINQSTSKVFQSHQVRSILERWSLMAPTDGEAAHRLAQEFGPYVQVGANTKKLLAFGTAGADSSVRLNAAKAMLRDYRSRKSVFYHPDQTLAKRLISQLLREDPLNRRLYNCFLLEFALDARDEASVNQYVSLVFDPDEAANGPILSLTADDSIRQVLYQLVNIQLDQGNTSMASQFIVTAADNKFLPRIDPLLSLVVRRLEHMVAGADTPYLESVGLQE